MGPMPKSDEDVSRWCKDIFVVKDALLDKHMATGTFGDEIRPLGGSVLAMPPPAWRLQILRVDSALVDMERRSPPNRCISAGGCQYAFLHHCLPVSAPQLYHSSEPARNQVKDTSRNPLLA
ncbi:hypothetical protein SETIT_3G351000v2 [Setaria italica]|uniref:Acyltransferase C-terminal domain-containing protein n=1 Tax=Setaria italica TaxID=4555 RepID=A0A368QP51_SETIT|nr:hypothetical protein SETIT_3G351000v2 [Setaria italica]